MFKPKDKVVAKWVENRARNLHPLPLRDVITIVLNAEISANSKRKISAEEIAEAVEELVKDVALRLAEIGDDYILQGVDPSFIIEIGDGDYHYRCKEVPDREFRTKLAAMTPSGFEHFCKSVLNKLSGNATVSGGPNDECVDFYAFGLPLAGGDALFPRAARLFVIGQAKRWKIDREIVLNDLREFIGGAILRADQLRLDHADRCGLLTPTCFAFWTTCDFSVGAREFADRMGLWYLNGKALSQLAICIGLGHESIEEAEAAVILAQKAF